MKFLFLITTSLFLISQPDFGAKFKEYGLVDIADVDPTIKVELKYSTTDNFTGVNMYGDLTQAYMLPEIAESLKRVQQNLKALHPEYSLLVYDAARPFSIQRFMFSLVEGTRNSVYVANPSRGGGMHNYGAAVDLTITDQNGRPLDMGSPFDSFIAASHTGNEAELVRRGLITAEAARNRALLTGLMKAEGFGQDPNEWWHFQKYTLAYLRNIYKLLDF